MDKIQKINADFYNKNAVDWTSQKTNSFYSEKEFRQFIKFFKKGDAIIDIGCGHGRDVPLFLGIGSKLKYEGMDISSEFLKIAKSRYPNLHFYKSNILEAQTLPKKKYVGFWAAATLQHIPENDWPIMLVSLEKISKKGAIGYITVPEDRPNSSSESDPRHFTVFTSNQFKTLVSSRKWKVVKSGILPATRATSVWRWFIVKLP